MRLWIAAVACMLAHAVQATDWPTAGRWASADHVTVTSPKAGAKFFLDITVGPDGSFKGSWEEFVCFNYSGPYGIVTISCQRSKKPSPASGKLDFSTGTGKLDLARLGKGAFRFKMAPNAKQEPQLDIELPKDWLRQGAPVLYETTLKLAPR
jgi:hypothetical protein